jgi:hypothetical protein
VKIKISKSLWEGIGKQAGWMKKAEEVDDRYCKKCKKSMGKLPFEAWKNKDGVCDKCGNRLEEKSEPKA